MSRPVITVEAGATVQAAAALLAEHGITALPVVDGHGQVIGIVSEADLLRGRLPHDVRSHLRPQPVDGTDPSQSVGAVMTRHAVCVPHGTDVADIARLMLDRRIRTVPVVDGSTLIGIVSRRDLVRTLLRDDGAVQADIVARLHDYAGAVMSWQVEVRDGVATISGDFADDEQRRVAELMASSVPGVLRVHSRSPEPLTSGGAP